MIGLDPVPPCRLALHIAVPQTINHDVLLGPATDHMREEWAHRLVLLDPVDQLPKIAEAIAGSSQSLERGGLSIANPDLRHGRHVQRDRPLAYRYIADKMPTMRSVVSEQRDTATATGESQGRLARACQD